MTRRLRSAVPQVAVQKIQTMILSGEFPQGGRLPSERQLAGQLAVSRASLREAMSVLETMGVVRTEPGRGTFVIADGGPDATILPLPMWRFASLYTLHEVYQSRHLAEGYAARLAAMAITDEEIAGLQKLVQLHKEATRTRDFLMSSQADFELHHRIMVLSKNRVLVDLHQNYSTIFLESQRLPMARHERMWEPVDEHEKLAQAIARRDPDGAEYYMRLHITRAADRVGIALSDTPRTDRAPGEAPLVGQRSLASTSEDVPWQK
jgi:GntR family transcriptional regulator, transcriptional repressor for pyruvate dehydrogenase complex